jgi:hypothetical protein
MTACFRRNNIEDRQSLSLRRAETYHRRLWVRSVPGGHLRDERGTLPAHTSSRQQVGGLSVQAPRMLKAGHQGPFLRGCLQITDRGYSLKKVAL